MPNISVWKLFNLFELSFFFWTSFSTFIPFSFLSFYFSCFLIITFRIVSNVLSSTALPFHVFCPSFPFSSKHLLSSVSNISRQNHFFLLYTKFANNILPYVILRRCPWCNTLRYVRKIETNASPSQFSKKFSSFISQKTNIEIFLMDPLLSFLLLSFSLSSALHLWGA